MRGNFNKKYTEEDVLKWINDYNSGMCVYEIEKKYHISRRTFYMYANQPEYINLWNWKFKNEYDLIRENLAKARKYGAKVQKIKFCSFFNKSELDKFDEPIEELHKQFLNFIIGIPNDFLKELENLNELYQELFKGMEDIINEN